MPLSVFIFGVVKGFIIYLEYLKLGFYVSGREQLVLLASSGHYCPRGRFVAVENDWDEGRLL